MRRAQRRVPAMAPLAENKEAGLGGSVPSVCPGVQDACLWSPASLFSINPGAWLSPRDPCTTVVLSLRSLTCKASEDQTMVEHHARDLLKSSSDNPVMATEH